MNRKFEYRRYSTSPSETIELLSINVFPKIKLEYVGLELKIIQEDVYKIIFIDKYDELIEEEIDSLASLKPINN